MELKVGMKAIIVNSRNHSEYNFQMCEIKEIENSHNGKIFVELHSDNLATNFWIYRNELIPLIYENLEDLKNITVEDISKLFTEYKVYYDVICSVANDISRESDKKEEDYKNQIDKKNFRIKEMQHHIDSLESDKSELRTRCKDSARDNFDNHLYGLLNIVGAEDLHPKFELPTEPINVAEMLIYATQKRTNPFTGKEYDGDVYTVSDLRQIAEHLLVYCNNSEDE